MDAYGGNLRDPPSSRMLSTQLLIASCLGLFAVLLFAALRNKFPQIFMARLNYLNKINSNNNSNYNNSNYNSENNNHSQRNNIFTRSFLNISGKSFFNSLWILHKIKDEEIIDFAGLDAYVFLGFFKMSIKLLFICWLFAFTIISPVRYHFTGDYDEGDNNNSLFLFNISGPKLLKDSDNPDDNALFFNMYLSLYVIFTYLFTYITCSFLIKNAKKVINKRQEILGKQNSITDRTIRLSGIPPELRTEKLLKDTIENLKIGSVEKIVICKEWKKLDSLFKQRSKIIEKLEYYWSNHMRIDTNTEPEPINQGNIPFPTTYRDDVTQEINNIFNESTESFNDSSNAENGMSQSYASIDRTPSVMSTISYRSRPKIRIGKWGLFGKKVDALNYYTNQLFLIDEEIINARKYHYPATPTAFVTMDSVATAQTLAQAVLDPRIGFLISNTAPAPADIIWENATLPSHSRKLKIYYITVITGILGVIFIFPVGYLATLLNLKSIKKFWPDLAKFLMKHEWASKLIIDLLPVYLYTLLNGLIPFLYVWLSSKQGFVSHGEEELSVVSKNFFYVFVNLFLVFTMAGTASNYWGYLSDSKQLALQLAQSLRGLSSFYVDTIILQGIGLMPFKLLPIGRIFVFISFWLTHSKSDDDGETIKKRFIGFGKATARELTDLYQPPIFNFGLQLPHPLLTLVITLIYSVISTKILSSGLVYFIIGYYVYKYLLIYTYIHPQHSTGKVMPIIFRRVILGLLLFQLTVAGSLVLEKAWVLAVCLIPLPLSTLMVLWYFQEKLKPLSIFIALRAIDIDNKSDGISTSVLNNNESNSLCLRNNVTPNYLNTNVNSTDHDNIWETNLFNERNDEVLNRALPKSPIKHGMNLKTTSTIDERREQYQNYEYPALVDPLEGPWVGIENFNGKYNDQNGDVWILLWSIDGFKKRKLSSEIG